MLMFNLCFNVRVTKNKMYDFPLGIRMVKAEYIYIYIKNDSSV